MLDMLLDPVNLALIILASIVFMKLNSVLGSKGDGNDEGRQINVNEKIIADEDPSLKSVSINVKEDQSNIHQIREIDSRFEINSFLEGAKAAYEMIVEAFASGDIKSVKTLLDKDLYTIFNTEIQARSKSNAHDILRIMSVDKYAITETNIEKNIANITVRFESLFLSTKYNEKNVIQEDATEEILIRELWTFQRNLKSANPNWKVVSINELIEK